jgi:hypothetical protein
MGGGKVCEETAEGKEEERRRGYGWSGLYLGISALSVLSVPFFLNFGFVRTCVPIEKRLEEWISLGQEKW